MPSLSYSRRHFWTVYISWECPCFQINKSSGRLEKHVESYSLKLHIYQLNFVKFSQIHSNKVVEQQDQFSIYTLKSNISQGAVTLFHQSQHREDQTKLEAVCKHKQFPHKHTVYTFVGIYIRHVNVRLRGMNQKLMYLSCSLYKQDGRHIKETNVHIQNEREIIKDLETLPAKCNIGGEILTQ